MARKQSKGRGWHGDSQGHAAAGRKGGLASRRGKQGSNENQQQAL
ncbi:MAG TPA: hypothetical protein VG917_05865 [Patescibacteria group bacterium]|nr:hypothetical protein [Patescibacteria group bacterium]